MKIANIMIFARCYNNVEEQFEHTAKELRLVNEFEMDNTFLLEYDAICNESYQKLFREEATEKTEIGLWLEIVEPLTTACNMPYRTKMGLKWDYHIIPGFLMGYTPKERETLADEAMRKFKEVFGYYPKTVACWLIDTHTINYLAANYEIDTFAICRDQVNFDAYTLMGGYFNQAYYPSKNNMFTPAQTDEYRVNIPVFRLLGPCPIHNYELGKYSVGRRGCTLEPIWCPPECFEGLFKTFYENESLGFAYAQFGQENTLRGPELIPTLRTHLEKLASASDVQVLKMCDSGKLFKETYPGKTPATAVVAIESWDGGDTQSVYYDSERYVADVFRFENSTFIRSFFLFEETVEDHYLKDVCETPDAIYENLPIVDTQLWIDVAEKKNCGLVLDSDAEPFSVERMSDSSLKVYWKDKYVLFEESRIVCKTDVIRFYFGIAKERDSNETEYEFLGEKHYINPKPNISISSSKAIRYEYKGNTYYLNVVNATVSFVGDGLIEIVPTSDDNTFFLYPRINKL